VDKGDIVGDHLEDCPHWRANADIAARHLDHVTEQTDRWVIVELNKPNREWRSASELGYHRRVDNTE
jgi:hypothetical protein